MLAASFILSAGSVASAETRTLKLYFIHTKERAEITYKRNGRYIKSGLDQINRFLRDWRRNEPTNMDPRLLDLVWEVYRQSGSRDYIHVVSAYRSPKTNAMLRSRSSGVAEKSQHMLGKAMDFYIPDVKLSKLRAIALKMQVGGVGYYPRSGSPFVHLDVGSVRHWPRMSRSELAALFPDGKTLYVPSDGKPMPGYKQALAAYEARMRNGGNIQIADDSGRRGRGLLAALFGGTDEEEDNAEVQVAAAPRPERRVSPQAPEPPAPQQAVQPQAQPQQEDETPATLLAALPAREVPVPRAAPRPGADVGASQAVALAESTPASDAVLPQNGIPALVPAAAGQPVEEVQTALNVPVPTRRPDHVPSEEATVVAEAEGLPAAVAYVTPTRRPEPAASADAIAELLAAEKQASSLEPVVAASYLPVPSARPAESQPAAAAELAEQVIAKADALNATTASAAMTPAAIAELRKAALKEARQDEQRIEASPRVAMLENKGVSPAALMSGGVKTTPKGPRPSPSDAASKHEPRVLPVEGIVAELAISPESVLEVQPVAKAPGFSMEMAEAPKAVYTDGFKQEAIPDARRFTGKAVTFLSLAKFE